MWRIFGIYVRSGSLVLGLFELLILVMAFTAIYRVNIGGVPPLYTPQISALLVWVVMFSLGIYETASRVNMEVFFKRLLLSSLVGVLLLPPIFGAFDLLPDHGQRQLEILTIELLITCVLALLTTRYLLRVGAVSTVSVSNILILGTGVVAENLRRSVDQDPRKTFRIIGHCEVDSDPTRNGDNADETGIPDGLVVARPDSLCRVALVNGVSEIVVALDDRRGKFPTSELLDCKFQGIRITEVSTFIERETGRVSLESLYPSWLIFADGFRGSRRRAIIKRLFDIAVSGVLLVLVAPLLLLIMPLIKLDNPGPIFYRQTRVGLNGREFDLIKFRSMKVDAESDGKPRWAAGQDDRVTRVGRFIRKTRIDEIPQIFNVLRGDMSFVGPRPERPYFVEQLASKIPYYRERHRVKPGITGWSQINFPYGASIEDAREKLKYDLYYMKNYSILLDIVIIMKTARVVILSEGAR